MKTTSRSLFSSIPVIGYTAVWILLMIPPAFAQQPERSAEDRAKHQTETMKTELKLTPAQETKVYAINLKYAEKMGDVRNIADTAARRKSFETLNKQKDSELKPILTADQFKSYQKMVADMRAKRQQGGQMH
jgi:Spy/CpxP family protein refolding chaperone